MVCEGWIRAADSSNSVDVPKRRTAGSAWRTRRASETCSEGSLATGGRLHSHEVVASVRTRTAGVGGTGSRGRSLGVAMIATAVVMALCEECPRTSALLNGGMVHGAFLHSAVGGRGKTGLQPGRLRGGNRAAGCSPQSPHFSSSSLVAPLSAAAVDAPPTVSPPAPAYPNFDGADKIFLNTPPRKEIGSLEGLLEAVTESMGSENSSSGSTATAVATPPPLALPTPLKQPAAPVDAPGTGTKKGDVLDGGRYSVVRKLGAGTFGAVYCAYDQKSSTYSAVKMQKPGKKYSQVALDEVELLRMCDSARGRAQEGGMACDGGVAKGDHVVKLNSHFEHAGPKGSQVCMDVEMLGPSLLDFIKDYSYKGCPVHLVKAISRHVLTGLDFLHTDCNIIHTDVKPENVLLSIPGESGTPSAQTDPEWWRNHADRANGGWSLKKGWSDKLFAQGARFESIAKLVDLGNACVVDKPFTQDIQTIEYRSPEAILGSGYGTAADIWSVGCLVFELLTGEYLFDPKEGKGRVKYEREEDLLALQQELLGDMPLRLATGGKHSGKFFTPQGNLKHITSLTYWGISDVLVDKYGFPREEADECANFILPMLRFDPSERATAADMLKHEWVVIVEMGRGVATLVVVARNWWSDDAARQEVVLHFESRVNNVRET